MCRHFYEFWFVFGKHGAERLSKEHRHDEAYQCESRAENERLVEHFDYAVVFLCAVVVARYGLHTLIKTNDEHDDKHKQPVGNAESPYCIVAAVVGKASRHKYAHKACAEVNQERRHTYIHNAGSHNPQDADASCARAVQE